MSLVTTKDMLYKAMEGGYGIGAFNVNCLEMAMPYIQAAQEENSPIILQFGQKTFKYMQPEDFMPYIKALAGQASVPVAVHLDHSHEWEQNIRCLRAGFTSLMFDGSSLPLEQNIKQSAEVVRAAHACGVPVEGEIGAVKIYDSSTGYQQAGLADPDEVVRYVEESGVDFVAVAVGNMHGMPAKEAHINISLIEEIRRRVSIPLVMHGSTGIDDNTLALSIKAGITKVNVATEFNRAFLGGIQKSLEAEPDKTFPLEYMSVGMEAVKQLAKEKIRLIGSVNKA